MDVEQLIQLDVNGLGVAMATSGTGIRFGRRKNAG
jgi:hypothetical protein